LELFSPVLLQIETTCPDSVQQLSKRGAETVSIRYSGVSRFKTTTRRFRLSIRSHLNQTNPQGQKSGQFCERSSGVAPAYLRTGFRSLNRPQKSRRQEGCPLPPPVLTSTAFALCLKVVDTKPFT
jgi:hypothetical protein